METFVGVEVLVAIIMYIHWLDSYVNCLGLLFCQARNRIEGYFVDKDYDNVSRTQIVNNYCKILHASVHSLYE